jgi:hypothetical protein
MYEPHFNWITFVYYIYLDGVRYGESFYTSYAAVRAEIDRLAAEKEH